MSTISTRPAPVNPECCPDDDPSPCLACRNPDEWSAFDAYTWGLGPASDDGLGWAPYDDARWLDKPAGLAMVEMVDNEALGYRAWQTDLGDLLAERLEALAAEMRALDARTPEGYRDRRDAMLATVGI